MQNLSILAGWTDILVPRPEAQVVIEIMGKYKPTLLPAMPEVYGGLLAREPFRKMGLSSVKGFLVGAGPLPEAARMQLKAKTDAPLINIYGLTEAAPMVTATPWGGPEKPGTAGVPLPGTDLRILDRETGTRELPSGEAGEVCIKGPQVMQGYCRTSGKGEAVIREGWLHTGDIGCLDREGTLTILGRKEELILIDGVSIYPMEIDEALLTHPKVFEACTIGIPDEKRGAKIKAYVVLKPGETADAGEIIAHCSATLAPDKVPQTVVFIDALPRSAVGKILKGAVSKLDGNKPDHGSHKRKLVG